MTPRDWDFAFGNLGDPLADIKWWMTEPLPYWMFNKENVVDKETVDIIQELLDALPDSAVPFAPDWDWCWNELNEDSQAHVKSVRERATAHIRAWRSHGC